MKNYSESVREKIYMVTNGKCFYCGCKIDLNNFQVDHYGPKAKGGIDKFNRVPACRDCNNIKSNKTIEKFRSIIENYLDNDIHVRLINKHMGIKKKKVVFYFEKNKFEPI